MAKYSKGAQKKVERSMHEMKRGKLKSGRSGKTVKNRKQAIAIGLSEAREKGEKVPRKKAAKKSAAKRGARKSAAKKGAKKSRSAKKSTGTRKKAGRPAKRGGAKKSSSKRGRKKSS